MISWRIPHNFKIFIFFSLGKGYDSPFSCVCLHGDRKPDERKSNLEKFKSKKVKFLICTDVAARGLDIKGMYCLLGYFFEYNYISK